MINYAKKAVLNNMNLYFPFLNFHQSHSLTQAFPAFKILEDCDLHSRHAQRMLWLLLRCKTPVLINQLHTKNQGHLMGSVFLTGMETM